MHITAVDCSPPPTPTPVDQYIQWDEMLTKQVPGGGGRRGWRIRQGSAVCFGGSGPSSPQSPAFLSGSHPRILNSRKSCTTGSSRYVPPPGRTCSCQGETPSSSMLGPLHEGTAREGKGRRVQNGSETKQPPFLKGVHEEHLCPSHENRSASSARARGEPRESSPLPEPPFPPRQPAIRGSASPQRR